MSFRREFIGADTPCSESCWQLDAIVLEFVFRAWMGVSTSLALWWGGVLDHCPAAVAAIFVDFPSIFFTLFPIVLIVVHVDLGSLSDALGVLKKDRWRLLARSCDEKVAYGVHGDNFSSYFHLFCVPDHVWDDCNNLFINQAGLRIEFGLVGNGLFVTDDVRTGRSFI